MKFSTIGLVASGVAGLVLSGCGGDELNQYCDVGFEKADDGTCVRVCSDGYELVGDACLPPCPEDRVREGEECICAPGLETIGTECLPPCEGDDERIGTECLPPCPANNVRVGTECECANGYEKVNGVCVEECPPGTERLGVACVPECAEGYVLIDGECLEECANGWVRIEGICQPPCPENFELINGECLPICAAGTERVGDECLPICGPGTIRIDGDCVALGIVAGRVCDPTLGIWLSGVTVTITLDDDSELTTTTDGQGHFEIEGLPPGGYYVVFSAPTGYVETVSVDAGETVTVGPPECVPPNGNLLGAVCDGVNGFWVNGATVTLNDPTIPPATTNQFGLFQFLSIPPGDYVLTVTHPSGFYETRSATVVSLQNSDIGPEVCEAAPGSIEGRICGGDGFWLTNASVSTSVAGQPRETTTDSSGNFVLAGLPPGTYTVTITKGSFTTTIEVEVLPDQPTVLPAPVCIPPTTSIVVVTGVYDSVEDVLIDLGFVRRAAFHGTATPQMINPSGNVDVIDGYGAAGDFWLTDFLADPVWMAEYDIIFFNCGIDDFALLTGTGSSAALANLQNFVTAGGSIYASDWASEVVRQGFPGRIKWDQSLDLFSGVQSRVGNANTNQQAQVVDAGLAATLGTSSVVVNLNYGQWVVMQPVPSQAADVRVLLKGNIQRQSGAVNNVPLTVRFDLSAGRVLYTSVHNEGVNTQDLEDILNYIVFEL